MAKRAAAKKTSSKKAAKVNSAYILLDRTGSMSSMWNEAIGAVNLYVDGLDDDVNLYLAVFDSESYDVVRNCRVKDYDTITIDEFPPRSMTNLYDATGKIADQMLKDTPDKAVLVIMTDGEENSSKEYTLDDIKKKLKMLEKKNWPTNFLGANFKNVTRYTTSTFGVSSANVFNTSAATIGRGMVMTSAKTMAYFSGDAAAMSWTDQEKAEVEKGE